MDLELKELLDIPLYHFGEWDECCICEREPSIFTPEGADILMNIPNSITAHGEI
jgi:hypothetical protein